jgi:hypothetical protein
MNKLPVLMVSSTVIISTTNLITESIITTHIRDLDPTLVPMDLLHPLLLVLIRDLTLVLTLVLILVLTLVLILVLIPALTVLLRLLLDLTDLFLVPGDIN